MVRKDTTSTQGLPSLVDSYLKDTSPDKSFFEELLASTNVGVLVMELLSYDDSYKNDLSDEEQEALDAVNEIVEKRINPKD